MTKRVVVIGAGIGGLTTAAVLAAKGLDVLLLEAHIYPGGCAGTFYHQGYRFDAGATLAGGFYPGGPMDRVAQAAAIDSWEAHLGDVAMVVHLPDGSSVTRLADERRFMEHRKAFGDVGERFFQWQEKTADALWDLALSMPPWPAQSARQWYRLVKNGISWMQADLRGRLSPELLLDAFRPVAAHLDGAPQALRQFVDAQLLISAQATSEQTNALYGASALDLPRRGVVHLEGGMGGIAHRLALAFQDNGGKLLYRRKVERIILEGGSPIAVEARLGSRGGVESFPVDMVIVNLPPWNITKLLGDDAPPMLRNLPGQPAKGWGAFMVYVGLDEGILSDNYPLHHQVIRGEPMGDGRTVFVSISPGWDEHRAPKGQRALTISTHTRFEPWWQLYESDRDKYDEQKRIYTERVLASAEGAIPGLRQAAKLILPGTPVTFERFTRRAWGWVGGFPQTSLFTSWGPRISRGIWMVGDSIFPGQSTAAVALGGLRVADEVCQTVGLK